MRKVRGRMTKKICHGFLPKKLGSHRARRGEEWRNHRKPKKKEKMWYACLVNLSG